MCNVWHTWDSICYISACWVAWRVNHEQFAAIAETCLHPTATSPHVTHPAIIISCWMKPAARVTDDGDDDDDDNDNNDLLALKKILPPWLLAY